MTRTQSYENGFPNDVGSVAYFIMFYLGVGNLFPWNAFITASSYYAQRFCGTSFESTFENYFSIFYTLSQTIGLALAVMYSEKLTLRQKVVPPLVSYSIIFAITTALVCITTVDPTLLFFLTLLSACLCGICGATLSGGLFSLGAMFPAAYTGALMNGQGLAGLIVSVSALLTSLAGSPSDDCSDDNTDDSNCSQSVDFSALAYFLIATFILITCVFAFRSLMTMKYTHFYINRATGSSSEIRSLLVDETSDQIDSDVVFETTTSVLTEKLITDPADDVRVPVNVGESSQKIEDTDSFSRVMRVYQHIFIPSFSVIFTFTVTISLFPSLTVFIESTQKCKSSDRFYNDLFVPFLFLLFNLFDFCGRVTAGLITPLFNQKNIWIGSVARLIFVPLFLLCNISDSTLPALFNNDAFPILFMIFFALSNGYISTLCMMMGASSVSPADAGLAGTIMIFSLTVGLFLGACFSFLMVFISQGSVA